MGGASEHFGEGDLGGLSTVFRVSLGGQRGCTRIRQDRQRHVQVKLGRAEGAHAAFTDEGGDVVMAESGTDERDP